MELSKTIAKIIFDEKPILSELSIKTYVSCISKVLELLKTNDLNSLLNTDEVIKVMNDNWTNPNTLKTKFASIIVLLKGMKLKENVVKKAIDKYNEVIEELSNTINTKLSKSQKSEDEKTNWSTDGDKEKLKEILLSKVPKKIQTASDLKNFRNYIIYLFYTDGIASRNDLAYSKILFTSKKPLSDEYNYILLDKKNKSVEYVMNKYKTFKSYGQKIIKLNSSMYEPLLKYKTSVDMFNTNNYFLLNDTATGQMTPNRLGVVFSSLGEPIGKKLSTTLNRHEKVSSIIPIEKMKQLSNEMGHSIQEQISTYAKI
jgi:hypothetical protein